MKFSFAAKNEPECKFFLEIKTPDGEQHKTVCVTLTDLMETEKIARIHCSAMDPGDLVP